MTGILKPGLRAWRVAGVLTAVLAVPLVAQEPTPTWERSREATLPPPTVFHATQVVNLPTAQTLARGEWQFEIGHRFLPAISQGHDALWGLDGSAFIRIGLGYALSDRTLFTAARSNFLDQWDFQLKQRILEQEVGPLPVSLALQGGLGWSTQVPEREATDAGNLQYYGQLILNARPGPRWAVGVVPSYLYNVLLERDDPAKDLYWGFYSQLYLTDVVSFMAEWNTGKNRGELEHDAGSLGLELETGGHFFKVFVGNSLRLNPTQYLAGADYPFEPEEWRLGFTITRLLRF